MEWLRATIELDGFLITFGLGNHCFDGIPMVFQHLSKEAMLVRSLLGGALECGSLSTSWQVGLFPTPTMSIISTDGK